MIKIVSSPPSPPFEEDFDGGTAATVTETLLEVDPPKVSLTQNVTV
jgi:hypothetical protein